MKTFLVLIALIGVAAGASLGSCPSEDHVSCSLKHGRVKISHGTFSGEFSCGSSDGKTCTCQCSRLATPQTGLSVKEWFNKHAGKVKCQIGYGSQTKVECSTLSDADHKNIWRITTQGKDATPGPLPSSGMGELAILDRFYCSNCGATGEIPADFANLKRIVYLYLNNNPGLTGGIAQLAGICRAGNNFGGFGLYNNPNMGGDAFPDFLRNCNLINYQLQGKGWTGTLPAWISTSWTRLYRIWLQNTQVTGQLPSDIGAHWSGMQQMYMNGNKLTGPIPKSFGDMKICKYFNIGHNSLTGTLPAELANMSKDMVSFSVYQNKLTGTIPDSFLNYKKAYWMGMGLDFDVFRNKMNTLTGGVEKKGSPIIR